MTPYTREALTMIRTGVACGQSPDMIRRQLGWDVSMFNNICNQNRIDARVVLDDAGPVIVKKDAAPPPPFAATAKRPLRGDIVEIVTSLSFTTFERLAKLAHRCGVNRSQMLNEIVLARVLANNLHQVPLAPRAKRGDRGESRAFNLPRSVFDALDREAGRRGGHVSVGMMVKAVVYQHFEGVT